MYYHNIFFDLDGTITDPKVGITKSVQYALNKMGIFNVELGALEKFIGPPLGESFMKFFQMSEEDGRQAIEYYREYFKVTGIYENELFNGMDELLQSLKHKGCTLVVATSKPTVFAEEIIRYFHLESYFTAIVGSNLDGSRVKKAEVIAFAMDSLGITDPDSVVMIGDREHDIIGAKENSVLSIGVEYGYGSREELESVCADFIVKTVDDLYQLLVTESN